MVYKVCVRVLVQVKRISGFFLTLLSYSTNGKNNFHIVNSTQTSILLHWHDDMIEFQNSIQESSFWICLTAKTRKSSENPCNRVRWSVKFSCKPVLSKWSRMICSKMNMRMSNRQSNPSLLVSSVGLPDNVWGPQEIRPRCKKSSCEDTLFLLALVAFAIPFCAHDYMGGWKAGR